MSTLRALAHFGIIAAIASACESAPTEPLDGRDAGANAPDAGLTEPDAGPGDTGFGRPDSGAGPCLDDPDCVSCAQEGECCAFSINCQPGSICNEPFQELYDPSRPEFVCVRVVCGGDADCEPPKVCAATGLCAEPACTSDAECGRGQICVQGQCGAPPSVGEVASCEVVGADAVIRQGGVAGLDAVARAADGRVLAGFGFAWTSSEPGRVMALGDRAVGGAAEGTARLTATVEGTRLACTGEQRITNLLPVPSGVLRVVVVDERAGSPIEGATVLIGAGANTPAGQTDARGAAVFMSNAAPAVVTAARAGYRAVTVFQPGVQDLIVPLSRHDVTRSAGTFGTIDLAALRRRDVRMGFVGPPIGPALLEVGRSSLMGEGYIATEIRAPELGVDDVYDMPGGFTLGLGNRELTADGDGPRCQGNLPSANQTGCFAVRAEAGRSAAWTLSANMRLSDVTQIADALSAAFGGGGGDLLLALAAFGRMPSFWHGLEPALTLSTTPNVPQPGSNADCANASLPDYESSCQPDFRTFQRVPLVARGEPRTFSVVNIPDLPSAPVGQGCEGSATLVVTADLGARGLLPLGVAGAFDDIDDLDPDCRVNGIPEPFGPTSLQLADGQLGLALAPPEAAAYGRPLRMLLVASAVGLGEPEPRATTLIQTVPSIGPAQTFQGTFLAYASGSVTRSSGLITLGAVDASSTFTRIELVSAGREWVAYVPRLMGTAVLPSHAEWSPILAGATGLRLTSVRTSARYDELFELGAAARIDRSAQVVTAVALRTCRRRETSCNLN